MNISITRIIDVSVDILNKDGISSLTMRKIADRLQIAAASLYFHVKDKREIYGLIIEYICSAILNQITLQDTLEKICFIIRKEYKAVGDSPQLFAVSPPITESRIILINMIFDKLRELGVSDEHLAVSGNLLHNYILSFVTNEKIWENYTEEDSDIPFEVGISDINKQFKFGLQVIFKGLEVLR